MKIVYFMFGAMIFLVSCGDVGKALRNEKTTTTGLAPCGFLVRLGILAIKCGRVAQRESTTLTS